MSKDEALRLALEALEANLANWNAKRKAIPIIKQALEQPVATNDTSQDRVDETAKQRHEPVAWSGVDFDIKTSPPKREWQGLTDDERNDCLVEADPCECLATPEAEELMRCIEAKLKEKNT